MTFIPFMTEIRYANRNFFIFRDFGNIFTKETDDIHVVVD